MHPLGILVAVYGVINIVGGVFAFQKFGSQASLLMGGVMGVLLLVAAVLTGKNPGLGFRMAGGICVILLGFWVYRLFEVIGQGKSPMAPAGNLVLALAVFAILGGSHMAAMKKRRLEGPGA